MKQLSLSRVQAIGSNDDYVNAMAQHDDKLVVIKFYDQFCKACDEIRPRYEELSRSLPDEDAMFYELEVRGSRKSSVFLSMNVSRGSGLGYSMVSMMSDAGTARAERSAYTPKSVC